MAHTRNRGRGPFRALRREVPSTVAVLAAGTDFAAMTRYGSFTFRDHRAYLRQTEVLLRALAGQGVHTRVACFDTEDYAHYCEEERLDPDSPASRTRYTAEVVAAGKTVPYEGQRIGELVPLLLDARATQLTWEEVTAMLADAGHGPGGRAAGTGRPPATAGQAAFDRAAEALTRLLEAAGPGAHHLVCSVSAPDGPLCAALRVERRPDGVLRMADSEALLLCGVLAAGMATGSPGGVVLRTTPAPPTGPPCPETVRGWSLRDGWPRPLTEAEVFAAYCTDADTGEPVPPEPGLSYQPGFELPRTPRPGNGPVSGGEPV